MTLPLLRDERPEWAVRELTRIVAERGGLAPDTTADNWAEPGLDVAPGELVERPIGFRPKDVRRDGAEEGSEVERGVAAAAATEAAKAREAAER